MTLSEAATRFMAQNPTKLGTAGPYTLWEHPTRGDEAPVYMLTPEGRILSTGFYDLGDLDAATCAEIAATPRITLSSWGFGGQAQ